MLPFRNIYILSVLVDWIKGPNVSSFQFWLLIGGPEKVRHELDAISICKYHLDRYCRANYLGHTTRHLSERISEHYAARLAKTIKKSNRSVVVEHLLDTKWILLKVF